MEIMLSKIGVNPTYRFFAAAFRETIETSLVDGQDVTINGIGVETVSDAFVDECFVKLLNKFDSSVITNKIKFSNCSPIVKSAFVNALVKKLHLLSKNLS